MKPYAYNRSELARVTVCLLKNEPTSYTVRLLKSAKDAGAGKPSVNSAFVVQYRPETG